MRNKLILIILGLILIKCTRPTNCKDYKTGKFIYANENFKEKITRNDTLQIEVNPQNGIEIHTSIEWKSDCEYVLTYAKILNGEDFMSNLIGQKIEVEIISTTEKGYIGFVKSKRLNEEVEFIKVSND